MNAILRFAVRSLLVLSCVAALAIVFGGPRPLEPLAAIDSPFKSVDYSDMPALERFKSRDGAELAFRQYPVSPERGKGSVVLVHSSSARSNSVHAIAKAFAREGYSTYALDMRGHGESGPKGRIAYIGQLEDDIEDFMKSARPAGGTTLVGFSSGGGFALRFAAGERQKLFASYLLLAPFLGENAPTYRPGGGGWVSVGLPRIIAITALDKAGITAFNDLPVINFALNEETRKFLTPQYSFAMEENFRPRHDFRSDIRSANQPMEVLVGQDDELFHSERFAAVFSAEGRAVPVTVVPKTAHIALTLDPVAIRAAVSAVARLNERSAARADH